MDRLTFIDNGEPAFRLGNCVYKEYEVVQRLYAYENTGFTPEEINHFREVTKMINDAADEETFIDHLNMLLDVKDKRIAELEAGLARLRMLLGEIEIILGGDGK